MSHKILWSQMSHIKSISQIMQCQQVKITRAKVNYKVSHNIHHSLMSAVVGEKSLVILSSIGVHMGLTLGPLCCRFMGGL